MCGIPHRSRTIRTEPTRPSTGNVPEVCVGGGLWGGVILNESSFDLSGAPPNLDAKTSRADILAFFDESVKRTRAAMDKSDPEYLAAWALRRGGQEMFSMPRIAAFRTFVLYHMVH